jgi:branched-chain amino acid aminotransferase
MWALLNDKLLRAEEARVSVFDRGFLYGDAVFETMAAYDGVIFRLGPHLDRFRASATMLGIAVPFSDDEVRAQLHRVLERNERRDAILRMSLTRGRGARGLDTRAVVDPTFLILCFPPKLYPAAMRARGARTVVSSVRRTPPSAVPGAAKTANYLNLLLAHREAEAADADEAILLTVDGDIAEATVSNVFLVHRGALLTPSLDCGIMPGITRRAVIDAADRLGIACREDRLPAALLDEADEIFYTNTSAGIMPVGAVGTRTLGAPGPITSRLEAGLHELIAEEAGRFWLSDDAA